MVETSKAPSVVPAGIRGEEFENFARKLFSQFESALTAFNNSVEEGRKFSHISFSESTLSLRFRYGNRGFEMTSEDTEIYLNWQISQTAWDVLHFLVLQPDGSGSLLVGLDGEAPSAITPRKLVQKLFGAVVGAPELEGFEECADENLLSRETDNCGLPVPVEEVSSGNGQAVENGLKGLFGQEFSESPVIEDGRADTGLSKLFDSASDMNSVSANTDTTDTYSHNKGATEPMLTTQVSSLEDAIVGVREVLQNELQSCANQGSRAFESQDMKAVEQAMNKLSKLKNLEARIAHDTEEWLEQLG